MGKRWKWLIRSRSKREECTKHENLDKDDPEEETKWDSDASNRILERTHVSYYWTEVPTHTDHLSDTDQTVSIIHDERDDESTNCPDATPFPFGLICCVPRDRCDGRSKRTQELSNSQPIIRKRSRPTDAEGIESIECTYELQHDPPIDSSPFSRPIPNRVDVPNHCTCSQTRLHYPHLRPSEWPQGPLLLRPKPNGRTRILGIRKEGSNGKYLWTPGQVEPWWDVLRKDWHKPLATMSEESGHEKSGSLPKYCEYCVILPINNGCERPHESLVVDFESPLFVGTLLFRLRGTDGTTREPYNDDKGFFAGKAIRYQAVIQGRFKKEMRFSDLVTGTRLDRPCGKLPPKWIMWTAMKVVQFFAPQLNAQLERCDKPYVLSALGSAPRTIIVRDSSKAAEKEEEFTTMSRELSEPRIASESLLGRDNPIGNSLERARNRKKQLDQWFLAQTDSPRAVVDKVYTFEFLQHLFDYQNFHIDIGNSMHAKVKDLLNGQPLQLMAEYFREGQPIDPANKLWAFEIWNYCLWDDAVASVKNPWATS